MGLDRKVSVFQGLRYAGGGPMYAWILHRISGIGIVVFVSLHVIASFFTQQMGSDWAIAINIVYQHWLFQIFVIFMVLFHALNGLRIVLLDFWPQFLQYQREAIWLEWAIFIPVYALAVYLIIQRSLGA